MPTQEDLSRTLTTLGVSFNPGSIQADVRAILADINAQGGVLGRKLVPVFHDNSTAETGNADNAAQANCAAFTQDRRVVAVLNPIAPIETRSFLQCMKQTRTPLLSIGYSTYDDTVYREFGPYLFTTLTPNVDRFVPSYIPALQRAGYFGGWDTTRGASAGTSPVVGLLEPDTRSGRHVAALHVDALRRAGIKVGLQYFYTENNASYGSDMSAAVFQFRNAGVTHVLDITNVALPVLVFAQTAQQQRYFPRYGMTSWLLPDTAAQVFEDGGVAQQLKGAVGIGWTPGGDVDNAHDPGETAPQKACRAAIARQGLAYDRDDQRFALNTAWALCDDVNLLVSAIRQSGGLTPQALRSGLTALQSFQPAVTFSNALTTANPSVPGSYRELHFLANCACFTYRGALRRIS